MVRSAPLGQSGYARGAVLQIRFDDIPALRAEIRESFGAFGAKVRVTQAMIDGFSELTGDAQWIHSDVERCRRESPWATTIAHGFLVLGLVGAMRIEPPFELVGARALINYGTDHMRFLSVVPSGSELHARRRLVEVTPKPSGTLLTSELEVWVVDAPKASLVYRQLGLLVG